MIREILFRGKRLDNGEWVYGYLVMDTAPCSLKAVGKCVCKHDGSYAEIFAWEDAFHEYNSFEVDPATVGQYTGMTDKNGVKIFEGDIIKFEKYYDVGCYPHWEEAIEPVTYKNGSFRPFNGYVSKIKVIGNIHDDMETDRKGAES